MQATLPKSRWDIPPSHKWLDTHVALWDTVFMEGLGMSDSKTGNAGLKSVRLDEELHHRADVYATKVKRTLKSVLEEALIEYLKSRKA